jgi:hypothetical protein
MSVMLTSWQGGLLVATSQKLKRAFRRRDHRWRWWLLNDRGRYSAFSVRRTGHGQ